MNYKIFNDSIHGHIELHPLCVKIIDTPEFQRLRAIRQLGGCYWVYPGAANNRFEHSLGVSYLAGQMARQLKKQRELEINDKDILCIEIAGLCHDLGHGPFSHMFDGRFIKDISSKILWTHEQGSIDMFCYMISQHKSLWQDFEEYGLSMEDILFIIELFSGTGRSIPHLPFFDFNLNGNISSDDETTIKLNTKREINFDSETTTSNSLEHENLELFHDKSINPPNHASVTYYSCFKKSKICQRNSMIHIGDQSYKKRWKYRGRGPEKSFLYEIVANHKTGVDVDKWDYFARDCHHLGLKNNFDYARLLKFNRVLRDEDGYLTICYKDKEAKNLYDMFYLRDQLHRKAYQHTVSTAVELMITEALVLANDHLYFPGKNGKLYRMSEAINDMEAFLKLTDYVYYQILYSTDPKLVASKKLLERIESRNLYKYIGRINFSSKETTAHLLENIKKQLIDLLLTENRTTGDNYVKCSIEDIIIKIVEFDYGMCEKDPMENVRFYSKDKLTEAKKIRKQEISTMLPENFAERNLCIYSKNSDLEFVRNLKCVFQMWCTQQNLLNISHTNKDSLLTPIKHGNNDTWCEEEFDKLLPSCQTSEN